MIGTFAPIETLRLLLEPITSEVAHDIIDANLAGLETVVGWPHEDTQDGIALAIKHGQPAGWLVTLEGRVIGECGTHGPVDEVGSVEIGYGLAASFRGQGYGTEVVAAISDWLLAQPEVRVIRANTLHDNTASRRVLEKARFRAVGVVDSEVVYERES